MSEYTKGPWAISKIGNDYDQYIIYSETDNPNRNIVNTVEGKDNAELIAAAPELLEACEVLIASGDSIGCSEDLAVVSALAIELIENAIAKATGQ